MNHPSGRPVDIYVLKDPRDMSVRYVGWCLDAKKRLSNHINVSRRWTEKNHKANWIRSLLKDGVKPVAEVVESSVMDFAGREKWWIKRYREEGARLTNGTDGGEGVLGHIKGAETLLKMSLALKGRPGCMKGKKHGAEARAKMTASRIGKVLSEGAKKKISAFNKGKIVSAETIEKSREARRNTIERKPTSAWFQLRLAGIVGRWTLIERIQDTRSKWRCVCDCGAECMVSETNPIEMKSQSCGCLQVERLREKISTHGEGGRKAARTAEYRAWAAMIAACNIKSSSGWAQCGARGISVCLEWRVSYEAFLDCMGRRPSKSHLLTRYPDRDGDYAPGNVRWSTPLERSRCDPKIMLYHFNGESKTIADWAEIRGMSYVCLKKRLIRGWTIDKALSEPSAGDGKTKRIAA